jgi:hypothetical protein
MFPNKETATAASAIWENWILKYGIQEAILSDKGKEYCSKLFDALCTMLDINLMTTIQGHPQCDGQSEKVVQTINKMIRAHVDDQLFISDLDLSELCFVYNTTPHETIGIFTFEVMFVRETIIPIDLLFPNQLQLTRLLIAVDFRFLSLLWLRGLAQIFGTRSLDGRCC